MKEISLKNQDFVSKNFLDLKYRLINKKSVCEKHFETLLRKTDIFYVREKANFKLGTYWCYYDFYIPILRLYIEIDGKEHEKEENKKKDMLKKKYVICKGCFIIRFTNEEVLKMNEITTNILLERLFNYVCKNKYYKSILEVRKNQEKNILKEHSEKLYKSSVYLYNNNNGNYYKFDNIIECIAHTGLKASRIFDMLEMEYIKSTSRMYVIGKTLRECEYNVSLVYE